MSYVQAPALVSSYCFSTTLRLAAATFDCVPCVVERVFADGFRIHLIRRLLLLEFVLRVLQLCTGIGQLRLGDLEGLFARFGP